MSITWPWLFGILGTYLIIKVNDDFTTSLAEEDISGANLALLLIFLWPLMLLFAIYHLVMSASKKKDKREFEFEWDEDIQPEIRQESQAKKTQTHYDNLKVSRDANPNEIRSAFKSLAQKYHPDKNQGDENAARVMLLVNKAYKVLSDPIERERHDEWIHREETNSKATQADSFPSDPPASQPQPQNVGQSTNSGESALVVTLIAVAVILAFGFLVEVSNLSSNSTPTTPTTPTQPPATSLSALDQFNLGIQYHNGQGVPQDYAQAAQWFRKAADQGYAPAQSNLGFMIEHGQGVTQDFAKAAQWFRMAADQGLANAQNNLGNLYLNGQGVPQDYAQAVQWFRMAADQGLSRAEVDLGTMYASGLGLPQSNESAIFWLKKAAQQGGDVGHVAEMRISQIESGSSTPVNTQAHATHSYHQHTYTNADLPRARPSCQYKAVMTNDDLRACGITPHD